MEPLEIAMAGCLAAGSLFGLLARAFAAFSRAKLEALVRKQGEKRKNRGRGADENGGDPPAGGERASHPEPDLAQTASLARNSVSVAFIVLLVTAQEDYGYGLRPFVSWFAGWAVVVELLPRVLGTSLAEPVVLWLGGIGRWVLLPLRPLGKMVFVGATALDRLRGKAEPENEEEEIEEEIRAIVAEGTTGGVLERGEGEMIESILRLGDADVAEIMTPRTDMVSIPAEAGLEEAIRIARDAGHSRVPVHEGTRDNIIGIFYVKDLLHHWGNDAPPAFKDLLRKPHFIPESRSVTGLLEELKRAKVHIAVVLDEYGGTAGLVTVEDIVEEVVGEITDEFDRKAEPEWNRVDDSAVEADARVHVDDINEALGVELPEAEDYDTVGGLVISLVGRIPRVGEKAEAPGVVLEVLDADPRRVKRLRIARVAEEDR